MRVPTYKSQTQRTAEIGGQQLGVQASPAASSAALGALGNLAGTITDITLDYAEKKVRAQNNADINRIQNDIDEDISQALIISADQPLEEREAFFTKELAKISNGHISGVSRDVVKNKVLAHFDNVRTNSLINMRKQIDLGYADRGAAEFYRRVELLGRQASNYKNLVVMNQAKDELLGENSIIKQAVLDGHITEVQAVELEMQVRREIVRNSSISRVSDMSISNAKAYIKNLANGPVPAGMDAEELRSFINTLESDVSAREAKAKRASAAARADFMATVLVQSGENQQRIAQEQFEASGGTYQGLVNRFGQKYAATLESIRLAPMGAAATLAEHDSAIESAKNYMLENPNMAAEYMPVVQQMVERRQQFAVMQNTDPAKLVVAQITEETGKAPTIAATFQALEDRGLPGAVPYTIDQQKNFSEEFKNIETAEEKSRYITGLLFGTAENPVPKEARPAIKQKLGQMLGLSPAELLSLEQRDLSLQNELMVAANADKDMISNGLKGAGSSKADVSQKVVQAMSDHTDALNASGASGAAEKIQQSVIQLASWRLATGLDPNLNKAVDYSMKAVTDVYNVQRVNGHNTLIPNTSGVEPSDFASVLQGFIGQEVLYLDIKGNQFGDLPEDKKNEMLIKQLKEKGRLAPFKNEDNEIIGYRLLTESGAVVLREDDSAIEIPFSEVMNVIQGKPRTLGDPQGAMLAIDQKIEDLEERIAQAPKVGISANAALTKLQNQKERLVKERDQIKKEFAVQDAQGQSTAPLDTSEQAEPEQAKDDKGGAVENNTTKLAPKEEKEFQKWIRSTGWFEEFVEEYGEEPDLNYSGYDYRGAWKAGVEPQRDKYDNNRYHWPSRFKSADHPTMWKESFMRETGGINPDSIGIKSEEDAEDYLDLFRAVNNNESDFYKDFERLPNPRKFDSDLEDLSLDELRFEAKRLGIAGLIDYLEEYYKEDRSSKEALEYSYKELITKFRKHNDDLYRINLFGFKRR